MKNTLIYKHKMTSGTVFLRSRQNGMNPESLYLEIYSKSDQKRHLEFLGLYFTGNPVADGKIKQDAIGQCINYSFVHKKDTAITFTSFCYDQVARIDKIQSHNTPLRAIKKLHLYANKETITLNEVNESFLLGFRDYLLNRAINGTNIKPKTLAKNTSDLYLSCIVSYANRAQRKGLIPLTAYSANDIPPIGKYVKVPITFTEEELVKLQNTPYKRKEICKALLFQFACGQRWGDIESMTWEQLILQEGQYKIVLKQEKTDKILPSFISKDLVKWVGEGRERKGKIFPTLPIAAGTILSHMNSWCKAAGIKKRVGTHTMRRTCATLLYKKGVELLTISKILGHSTIDITRRYIGIDEKDIKNGLDKLKEVTNKFNFGEAA